MTSRVQTLRSSTKKARPSGRAVGELYVNFPDQQFGVVGPSGNIDLLAVRHYSATTDYVVGDLVVRGGDIYKAVAVVAAGPWDGTKWTDIVHETDKHHGVTLFDASKSYLQGELVAQRGDIWEANSAINAGPFDATRWTLKTAAVGVVQFEATKNYAKDQLVSYQGKIYRAIAPVVPGAWTAAQWEDLSTPSDAVQKFDATKPYAINDLVSHGGKIYRAIAAITTPGAWKAAQWEDININPLTGIQPFDATKPYVVNDLVSYQGKIYRNVVAGAAAWNAANWADTNTNLTDAIRQFDATKAYVANDLVWDGGKIYRAPGNIAAGAFNATQWTEISVGPLTAGRIPIVGANGIVDDAELTYDATKNNMSIAGTVAMGSAFALRNKLINGGMDIWQRGTSGFGPGGYGCDRWYLDGVSATSQRSTDVPSGFLYSNEWGYPGTASVSIRHRIESANCVGLVGKNITVSFWAKSTLGSAALSYGLHYANTADTFSSVTAIANGIISASPSTSWTYYSFTIANLPASVVNGLQISINRDAGAAATTRITGVQLEEGTIATPFERRPIGLELSLCARYFQHVGAGWSGAEETANLWWQAFTFKAPMRAVPTIALLSTATVIRTRISENNGVDRDLNNCTLTHAMPSTEGAGVQLNNPAGGNVLARRLCARDGANHFSADAEL